MTVHFQDISDHLDESIDQGKARNQSFSGFYRDFAKRVLDFLFVVATLVVSVPTVAICAALVALDGHSPFYSQQRVGKGGRVFRIWKLRTMVPNADAMLARHLDENPDARVEWERTQKLKVDPRITRLGGFLRRSSIDELPQLFNVLIGDMSVVGPRPIMVSQAELYPGSAYFTLRPGITGSWQISDRNECAFKDRAAFDTKYNADLSLKTDASILLRTIGVVLRCTGY